MGARGMFDSAKHPHGFHGHFASAGGGVTRRTSVGRRDEGNGLRGLITRRSATAERARKLAIKQRAEVPRGVRAPANFQERQSLQWASPSKIADQLAKTGTRTRPKYGREGALHMARLSAGGFTRSNAIGTQGTYRTFTGKAVRVKGGGSAAGKRGAKLTSRGRFNLAKYGGN